MSESETFQLRCALLCSDGKTSLDFKNMEWSHHSSYSHGHYVTSGSLSDHLSVHYPLYDWNEHEVIGLVGGDINKNIIVICARQGEGSSPYPYSHRTLGVLKTTYKPGEPIEIRIRKRDTVDLAWLKEEFAAVTEAVAARDATDALLRAEIANLAQSVDEMSLRFDRLLMEREGYNTK